MTATPLNDFHARVRAAIASAPAHPAEIIMTLVDLLGAVIVEAVVPADVDAMVVEIERTLRARVAFHRAQEERAQAEFAWPSSGNETPLQ